MFLVKTFYFDYVVRRLSVLPLDRDGVDRWTLLLLAVQLACQYEYRNPPQSYYVWNYILPNCSDRRPYIFHRIGRYFISEFNSIPPYSTLSFSTRFISCCCPSSWAFIFFAINSLEKEMDILLVILVNADILGSRDYNNSMKSNTTSNRINIWFRLFSRLFSCDVNRFMHFRCFYTVDVLVKLLHFILFMFNTELIHGKMRFTFQKIHHTIR